MRHGSAAWGAAFAIISIWLPGGASAGETITYSYDSLGRLAASSTAGTVNNNQNQMLGYDAAGNRAAYSFSDGKVAVPVVSIGNSGVTEGGLLTFPVTLSASTTVPVTVQYMSSDGTAISGSDYTPVSGTLNFVPGQTAGAINVQSIDDTSIEADETFTVYLSSPTNATIGVNAGTGTIINNDFAWTSSIVVGKYINCVPVPQCFRFGYVPGAIGSMSNTNYNGRIISSLFGLQSAIVLTMTVSGTPANSGWTSITVPGVTGALVRTAATYSASGSVAQWSWSMPGNAGPQMTNGTVVIVQ